MFWDVRREYALLLLRRGQITAEQFAAMVGPVHMPITEFTFDPEVGVTTSHGAW
jgi:hypothetical protein